MTEESKYILVVISLMTVAFIIITHSTTLDREIEPTEEPKQEQIDSVKVETVKENKTFEHFVNAVIYVESRNDSMAFNVKENAVGVLQIRPIMLREVNRVLKMQKLPTRYCLNDRWSPSASIEMFNIIASRHYKESLTDMKYYEIVARKWNGGGKGHLKQSTLKYWSKVKARLMSAIAEKEGLND